MKPMTRSQLADLPFILVSGQARSGTTVLTRAIAAHPDVLSNGLESTWLRDVLDLLRCNLDQPSRMRQCVSTPEEFIHVFRAASFELLFPDKVFPVGQPQAVSAFSSLKHDVLDQVQRLLPNVKLLNIVRNGVEVVSSRMIHRAIGKLSFEEHCEAWARSVDVVKWAERQSFFKLIRHEQLLGSDASKLFAEIQSWVGLRHSEAVHSYVSGNLINTTEQEGESVSTPDQLSRRAERWQHWTASQKAMFEDICGDAMAFFGYALPELE